MTQPDASRSWRSCPFKVGGLYRIKRDFAALRDRFIAGEEMRFHSDAWSRYDGMSGYFFAQESGRQLRAWDICDNDDISVWTELFEEVI